MRDEHTRTKEQLKLFSFAKKMHDYAYNETIILLAIYLIIGYAINPKDICILNTKIPFLIMLLSIITLFHGFESGVLAIGIIAIVIWYFYPIFQYKDFLTTLIMMLIFGQFNYYWTRRIYEAETNSNYCEIKLNELSKAFYTLKISHDQLEKNYVIKPMSLRNSIKIIQEANKIDKNYYINFLRLLDKSFNVNVASIAYKQNKKDQFKMISMAQSSESDQEDTILNDPLIQEVLQKEKPVYISDNTDKKSKYIAVLPALQKNTIIGLLLIQKMPFMSFNKENLTSIAILFEYFFNETVKHSVLLLQSLLPAIHDNNFKFEYHRLNNIYKAYQVNSATLVLKIDDRLLMERLYSKIVKILRSLDMVTFIKYNKLNYIILLFPFADNSVCTGFINRLIGNFKDIKEDDFEYMIFDFSKVDLLQQYISIDHER